MVLKPRDHKRAEAFTRIPNEEGWDDVLYFASAIVDPYGHVRPIEHVYILTNRSMPNMIKIGMTTRTVTERAREISKATGVPTPWIPVFDYECYRSDLLEAELHEYFSECRVSNDREMFNIDVITVQNTIRDIGFKYSTAMWDPKVQELKMSENKLLKN